MADEQEEFQENLLPVDPEKEGQKANFDSFLPKEITFQDILTHRFRDGWKPDVSGLKNAIVDGVWTLPTGSRLLIEYPDSWRDTTLWHVVAVDPAGTDAGYVRLYDPFRRQYGSTSYVTGPKHNLIFKVPEGKRKWFPGETEKQSRKKIKEEEE